MIIMKEGNGFKEKWMVLGGHRVKVLVPPHKSLEERIKGLEKFGWKVRKIARERVLKRAR